ncbi:MAG: S24 family peptidase [Gammaproteobacteria bacterium]
MKKSSGHAKHHGETSRHVSGFGSRMATVSARLGTRKMAASAAGVSVDSLQRYLREERFPPIDVVAALAAAADVCVRWLITGEGSVDSTSMHEFDRDASEQLALERPLLFGYEAVGRFLDGRNTEPESGGRRRNQFALLVESSAMAPLIPKGSRLTVDASLDAPRAGEFLAVVLLPAWREVVVRRWILDLGTTRLEPIASGYRSLDITDVPHRLAGSVLEVATRFEA